MLMLIEFTVGNFRSFKDPVTFSMVSAKLRAKDKALDENNVFSLNDKINLLKSCAIYGANASGKSNLIHAFQFIQHFVLNSATGLRVDQPIDVDRFRLSMETVHEPSFFEMVFHTQNKLFRYGFAVDGKKVHSEWLYHVPQVKEANLFYREGDEFDLSGAYKEGKGLEKKTRDNALFLSVVAQFNGTIALKISEWFRELEIKFSLDDDDRNMTMAGLRDEKLAHDIISIIKPMDLGISGIDLVPLQSEINVDSFDSLTPAQLLNQYRGLRLLAAGFQEGGIVTKHTIHNGDELTDSVAFDLDTHESEGTKKLFALAGPILKILKEGKTLIIDELDARLHPLITKAIIQLFNSNETNPNNAQLVFTTHDTNLLTNKLFRRDQIWFTEKSKYGATDLYSLAEIKVRNDATYEKDYIAGKYGAIPFIGGLHRLVEETDG